MAWRASLELRLLIDDRFDVVELIGIEMTFPLRDRLAETGRVRLRLRELDGVFAPRMEIGEVALLMPDPDRPRASRSRAVALTRAPAAPRPDRDPRAARARSVPEAFDISGYGGIMPLAAAISIRHRQWRVDCCAVAGIADGSRSIACALAPDAIVRLDHGSRIRFDDDREPWVFLARDATAEAVARSGLTLWQIPVTPRDATH